MNTFLQHQDIAWDQVVAKGVYFYYAPANSPEETHYPHGMICLAEGLRELGVPVYANVNYWRFSADPEEYLFRHCPGISPSDCAIVVLDRSWFDVANWAAPEAVFKSGRDHITVYIDSSDGAISSAWKPSFRDFDIILKMHMLDGFSYPSNFHPWAFGLSNRMLESLDQGDQAGQRQRHFHVNFRNTAHQHSVRRYVSKRFLGRVIQLLDLDIWEGAVASSPLGVTERDRLYWAQTGRRHNPEYYRRLSQSLACACFSGFFIEPFSKNHASQVSRFSKRLLAKINLKTSTIVQWDSWRLWESLAAGCASFQAEFNKYHFSAPVKPENWRHYIGVDFDDIDATIERLFYEPTVLQSVAEEGQKWVIKHYAPRPVAVRFLETLYGSCPLPQRQRAIEV
jgi:hypothetical protein